MTVAPPPRPWLGYAVAMAGVVLTTGLIHLIPEADHIANISLLYLLVVIGAAYRFGGGPAVLAAVTAVLSFDYFFVEPRGSFITSNPSEWLELAIFLVTAIVIGQLTQDLRLRVEEARQRELETDALAQASWAVASQVSHQLALNAVLSQMTAVSNNEAAAIVARGEDDNLQLVASHGAWEGEPLNLSVEERCATWWVLEQGRPASQEELPFDQANDALYLPLMRDKRVLGVLLLRWKENRPLSASERRVVESLANHAAVALERQRLSQAQAQAEVLLEADKLKSALLSMVSHDFRSPLAAIKTSVTGLLQDGLPWDVHSQRELLSGINQETDRLNRMVGDILALSRLEADAWRPQCELVAVEEVIGAALDAFNTEENARIRVNIESGLPEISLDSVQIVQVLHNLVENALKYSPTGSPVELCVQREGDMLSIEVLDRGFGLPSGEESKIFGKFYRAERWRESSLPGTGIGLAICLGLAEAHGGSLRAQNRTGGGASFRLLLPLTSGKALQ